MANEPAGDNSEDREAIRLARARLIRVCRLAGAAADEALTRAANQQRVALVAVAMRVLSASPEDLAAGRVLPLPASRAREPWRPTRPKGQRGKGQRPANKPYGGRRHKGRR
jgi:hypothetical protein